MFVNIINIDFFLCKIQYFEYSSHQEIRHNIQKELCVHASFESVKLEECQYKGHNTFTGPEQKWVIQEVMKLYYIVLHLLIYPSP